MSRYLLPRLQSLAPYVPGEQPQDRRYVKLNTNESPFPPSPRVLAALNRENISRLNLYPDPLYQSLRQAIADEYGLAPNNVFVGNGSDEVLGFAFMAYADETRGATIPDVSYGFYRVYAQLFRIQPEIVPLNEDFTLPVEKFVGRGQLVAIANPNAPTSIALPLSEVERIIAGNPDSVVLVDEAYVDFGGETCVPLLSKYPNLLIVRTYSKSRSLAGGRLGYALASPEIVDDLNRVKSSFHPYSVNNLTMLAGIEAMRDREYFASCVSVLCAQREESIKDLRALGFTVLPSATNFLFAAAPGLGGHAYYQKLKARGILVRYLNQPTLTRFVRITVGSAEQMRALLNATEEILKEAKE
ncbi:MAG TPA: histidinol-phosphate transaminase [Candidatus Limiplasma sp.]|nr:histidinol-phosphate transaminase [Candidatus Limiplasma sp.]HPR79123.1 histidinol-phosphate transaminase [Candidatus Limiplasma sp.]